MNGFMMCVLLAATGQVGEPAERDFGWLINPDDGKLEYIVQLSPQKANYMVSAAKEQESAVPTEIAVRLSRVVVRIGTEPLVSTPIEEVIEKVPPVSAAVLANIEATAGRGRFSQLEKSPAGEVKNVNGNGSPPPLSTDSGTALPETPGALLAEQASELRSNLADALTSRGADALRSAETLLAQNLPPNTLGSASLTDPRSLGTAPNKYSNTATQPAIPPAGSPPSSLPGSQSNTAGTALPSSNYATSPTHNHAPGDGFHNDGTAAAPPNNSSIGMSGRGSPYPTGNGSLQGATSGATAGPPYANPGSYGSGTTPGYSSTPGYATTTPGYASTVPSYNSGQGSGMTPVNSGNFGGVPRGAQTQAPYNEYASVGTGSGLGMGSQGMGTQGMGTQYPPYGQSAYPYNSSANPASSGFGMQTSPYASDPLSLPSGNHQPTRVADNRPVTSFPSTSGSSTTAGNTSTAPAGSNTGKTRPAEQANDADLADSYANGRSGMENILPVMFVLSLVVNFYLGMLIRKLLARYRSLLSSVRSQAV